MDDQKTQELVNQTREWINRQPHLPKNIEDKIILKFLHSCYYDLEKAKITIELFFSIRASAPELLTNRDPLSPHIKKALSITNLAQYEIADKKLLWIWQLNDPGLDNYDYTSDAKLFFLSSDAWLLESNELSDMDIALLDVKDISMKFLTKFNMSIAKKMSKYQEDAMPIRLKEIHIINAPPFIDKLFGLIKPFLKQEVTDVVHFHSPNSETLYQYINKEHLPSDYGGNHPSMAEWNEKLTSVISKHRTTLIDENFWKTDKKAKGSIDIGTFKKLDID